jgi:hypothetical protein
MTFTKDVSSENGVTYEFKDNTEPVIIPIPIFDIEVRYFGRCISANGSGFYILTIDIPN